MLERTLPAPVRGEHHRNALGQSLEGLDPGLRHVVGTECRDDRTIGAAREAVEYRAVAPQGRVYDLDGGWPYRRRHCAVTFGWEVQLRNPFDHMSDGTGAR